MWGNVKVEIETLIYHYIHMQTKNVSWFLDDINEIKSKTMNKKSMELSLSYKHHAEEREKKNKITKKNQQMNVTI